MNTSEFRDIELQIREEKLLRIKWDEKRKRSMENQRYRAKMERPKINYIPKGLSVDYEEEYSKYLMQEVSFEPRDNDDFGSATSAGAMASHSCKTAYKGCRT